MQQRRKCRKDGPLWIEARYPGRCPCGQRIRPGDRGYYYPSRKRIICKKCGILAEAGVIDDELQPRLKAQ